MSSESALSTRWQALVEYGHRIHVRPDVAPYNKKKRARRRRGTGFRAREKMMNSLSPRPRASAPGLRRSQEDQRYEVCHVAASDVLPGLCRSTELKASRGQVPVYQASTVSRARFGADLLVIFQLQLSDSGEARADLPEINFSEMGGTQCFEGI